MTTEARDSNVERSHRHMGSTDVENTDSECERGGPGVIRINTPEQGKNISVEKKLPKRAPEVQLTFNPHRRDKIPSIGNINEAHKVREMPWMYSGVGSLLDTLTGQK